MSAGLRWCLFVLVIANAALAAWAFLAGRAASPDADLVKLEMNAEQVKVVGRPGASTAQTAVAPGKAVACMEWGTFASTELERAQAQAARLAPAGMVATRELADAPAWWVYIPPLKTREEVEKKVSELKGLGVTEFHVVADNERWRNAISLGIFKTEEAATNHLGQLKARNVRTAVVGQRNNLIRQSVIVLSEPSPALVGQLAGLRQEFPGTELKAVKCPAGAS